MRLDTYLAEKRVIAKTANRLIYIYLNTRGVEEKLNVSTALIVYLLGVVTEDSSLVSKSLRIAKKGKRE